MLTHKWIFYALSVLVASIAAHESARFLIFLGVVVIIGLLKRILLVHCLAIIVLGIGTFIIFSIELKHLERPLELPALLTWTDQYKINGSSLRGFMTDKEGRRIYVVYEFRDGKEKKTYESIPLVGQQYHVYGSISEPTLPAHQYAFNMISYLRSKGAIGILEIEDWTYVENELNLMQKISYQRFILKEHIEKTFPESLIAEAQSLLIGYQENVDGDVTRAYQKLGITHLFAISGLHIAIISFIFFQGLLRLGVRRELATMLLIIILPVYAVLAGGAPSVWRAVTVVELVLLTKLKWKMPINDALAISFILFVLLEPWSIYQIGFQLSYLATISLLYSTTLLSSTRSWLVQSFLITFVCQLIVYPLLLFHFYELSLSSFVVNIFFVPLFSFIITPVNIILLLSTCFPEFLSKALFFCYEPLRECLQLSISWLQSLPNQMWISGKPSIFFICLLYVSVFIVFYMLDIRAKLWKVLAALFVPIIVLYIHNVYFYQLKISFVNVGQGDCIVIELPFREEVYVIDTGGVLRFGQEDWRQPDEPYEVGRQVVVPYLKGKGIHHIDKLILTHADSDHVEGAEEIVKEISVGEIHITPGAYLNEQLQILIEEAKQLDIPIKEQMAGVHWNVGHYSFQYLWPNENVYEGNNDSLVLYITNGNFQALLTGDLEEEGEFMIMKLYPQIEKIDLLKAGHHGSNTSSSEQFVQKMFPNLTIFSTGKNNRYGHPHKEVMERFHSLGLMTLNTAELGTIEVNVQEDKLEMFYSNRLFNVKKKALSN
nr:DNA internalization-related competence protein ComEC/Rec2 [Lysinibacillus timonensis]